VAQLRQAPSFSFADPSPEALQRRAVALQFATEHAKLDANNAVCVAGPSWQATFNRALLGDMGHGHTTYRSQCVAIGAHWRVAVANDVLDVANNAFHEALHLAKQHLTAPMSPKPGKKPKAAATTDPANIVVDETTLQEFFAWLYRAENDQPYQADSLPHLSDVRRPNPETRTSGRPAADAHWIIDALENAHTDSLELKLIYSSEITGTLLCNF